MKPDSEVCRQSLPGFVSPVAGLDGCRAGWCAVLFLSSDPQELPRTVIATDLNSFHRQFPSLQRCLIDIPIGLPDHTCTRRSCDTSARFLLGKGLTSRVFSPPTRDSLQAPGYAAACTINQQATGRKISLQAYNIRHKIAQCDDFLQNHPEARQVYRESHPELVFKRFAGHPIKPSKKSIEGRLFRLRILSQIYPPLHPNANKLYQSCRQSGVTWDDWLDALALALRARMAEQLEILPENPSCDARGRPMEIVF